MMIPAEKFIAQLEGRIARAWMANAEEIYPVDAAAPDPVVMSRIAATVACNFFTEIVEAATQ